MISPEQRAWANGYADLYLALYERIYDVVQDAPAAVSACNGAMIAADRAGMIIPNDDPAPKTVKLPGPPAEDALKRQEPAPAAPAASPAPAGGVSACPKCGNPNIDRVSHKTGRAYQACANCAIFINADGTTRPMGGW